MPRPGPVAFGEVFVDGTEGVERVDVGVDIGVDAFESTWLGVDGRAEFVVVGFHSSFPLRVSKKVANPVSIGRDFSMSNPFGFFRSIRAVLTVWMVRRPPICVAQAATLLKYRGIVGESALPTAVG